MDNKLTYTPMVVGYLIKNNRVLLGIRKKVSLKMGKDLITGIGGKVADTPELVGETTDKALVREFQEEIKVIPTKFESAGKVRFVFPNKLEWTQEVEIYRVYKWEGEPQETEVMKPVWYPKNELPFEQMWDDARYWTPRVLSGENIDVTIIYNQDNKTVKE